MQEIIYVLTNEAMPGYVKVGKTTTSLEQRMRELSGSTSVPLPFTCFYACTVKNASFVERQIHDAFDNNRPNKRREFFQIEPSRIVAALKLAEVEDITPKYDLGVLQEDIQALERARSERRAQFKFSLAKVPVGSKLTYINDPQISARVIDDKSIEFLGEVTSLSAAATKILGYKHGVQGTAYWVYEGEILDERRKRVELEDNEMPRLPPKEIILEVGAEGGSITLFGTKNNNEWAFGLSVIDVANYFIDDNHMEQKSSLVTSWESALDLLDQYPWAVLVPIKVHYEFRDKVRKAVVSRLEFNVTHDSTQHLADWDNILQQKNHLK